MVFWTVRPDNLDVIKLRATQHAAEQIITESGPVLAYKVSISLTGPLSNFWKAHYWFRETDGLFVRYEDINGLPGSGSTTLQLDG